MKKLSILTLLVMVACCMTGCADRYELPATDPADAADSGVITNPYHIPVEDALKNLDAFFAANAQGKTRADNETPKIKDVMGIQATGTDTRSDVECPDPLLYIANFDEDQGFAILSADERIGSLVLGVSEQGKISSNTQRYDQLTGERLLYKDFPLTGPGWTTDTTSNGDILAYINPNTVDFTKIAANDTVIGNLDTSGYDLLNATNGSRISLEEQLETIILELSINYAKHIIELQKDMAAHPDIFDPSVGGGSDGPVETGVIIEGPLLAKFKDWKQSPYLNKYFPKVRDKYSHFGEQAYTGCYPLALAKIMAYNRKPVNYSYNGHTFDWDIIGSYRSGESHEAALFLRAIAFGCNAMYAYEGTFVTPSNACFFLSQCGYKNAENGVNSFNRIKEMIDANRPLVIFAAPSTGVASAHAWNIDGYRTSRIGTSNVKMVHCDFGLGGNYNGYYIDGIFDLDNSRNIFDGPHSGTVYNYNHDINILYYDPKN